MERGSRMTSDIWEKATENIERLHGKSPTLEPVIAAIYFAGGAFVVTSLFRILSSDSDLEGNISARLVFVAATLGGFVQWRRREWYRYKITSEYMRLVEGRK
jgi:hypothetical protein